MEDDREETRDWDGAVDLWEDGRDCTDSGDLWEDGWACTLAGEEADFVCPEELC